MLARNLQQCRNILQQHTINLDDLFIVPPTPFKEKLLRKYVAPLVNILPHRYRYILANVAKKIRNPKGMLTLQYPLHFHECRLLADEISQVHLRPWWNKHAVLCMTHDVDNFEGYRFVKTMAELDAKYGLQTTFNFLTHAYPIDPGLLQALKQSHFEIGLHGDTHDQGFAFRKVASIKKRLQQARDALGEDDVVGYRSPALSLSENLLHVLGELNFLYDSTMQIASPFYYSVKIPYPYYLKRYRIWEVPLMVQDDNYLRDTHTSEKDFFGSVARILEETIRINGVVVINIHPHLMRQYGKPLYENFLRHISRFTDRMAYCSLKSVVEYGCKDH